MSDVDGRLLKLNKSYEDAVENFKERKEGHQQISKILDFVQEYFPNATQFFIDVFNGKFKSHSDIDYLVHRLNHDLYDDGAVTYVEVNGHPRVVFEHEYDDNFSLRCLSYVERQRKEKGEEIYNIEILKDLDVFLEKAKDYLTEVKPTLKA